MNRILWATVFYPTPLFNVFLKEHLETIANQTCLKFDLLIFLDNISKEVIQEEITIFQKKTKINVFFLEQEETILNPSQIRKEVILHAHQRQYDLLIFSDFDETMDCNRVEETLKQIDLFDFSFSSFYITDSRLKKLDMIDFQKKCKTPQNVYDISPIIDKNFIGLGNMAIKVKNPIFSLLFKINVVECCAFDWFLATFMLLHGLKGKCIQNTYVNYRQYQNSYTGIFKPLNIQKLHLGTKVKEMHYGFFRNQHYIFEKKFNEIQELKKYLLRNQDKYIKIINDNFDPTFLCWWENIKTLEEIKQWI